MAMLRDVLPRRALQLLVTVQSPNMKPLRQRLPYSLQILSLTPVLVAGVSGALLWLTPQLHEVYRSFVDTLDVSRALAGLFAVQLLGALLYCWNRDLNRLRIDQLYPNHADLQIDRHLFAVRHWKSLLCGFLPAAGLAAGLAQTATSASDQRDIYNNVVAAVGAAELPTVIEHSVLMDRLAGGLWIGVAATLLSSLGLFIVFWRFRQGTALGRVVYLLAGLLALFVSGAPLLRGGDLSIEAGIALGPLAISGALLIAITCGLIILSRLSRRLGLPLISLVVALGLFFTLRTLATNVSSVDTGVSGGSQPAQPVGGTASLEASFDQWWAAREDRLAFRDLPYPVFVFAIQGGGIYAASAGASYLATLQDHCPAATQHIFAVSAVSGGAMGTAVYQALAALQPQIARNTAPGCGLPVAPPMAPRISRVVEQDHLSPLLSFAVSDQLRKLDLIALGDYLQLSKFIPDRAQALESSFARALDHDLAANPLNDYFNAGDTNRLRRDYERSWAPLFAAPAVILNATNVEAGHRVAFSPFGLKSVGDGTLYAFSEIDQGPAVRQRALIGAAGVSSRIPGIVPPWTIFHTEPASGAREARTQRWNFVDGGYADGSGAATAFDLFRMLDQHIRADRNKGKYWVDGVNGERRSLVDLRLVMLTDSVAAPQFADIDGNILGDAIVTISTLMNIRRLLSVRAVTEAKTEAEKLGAERVYVSHLEHQTFPLSLGWRIAPSTNAIVQLLVGRPDLFSQEQCRNLTRKDIPDAPRGASDRPVKVARAAETIRTNSCTMQRLVELVAGSRSQHAAAQ